MKGISTVVAAPFSAAARRNEEGGRDSTLCLRARLSALNTCASLPTLHALLQRCLSSQCIPPLSLLHIPKALLPDRVLGIREHLWSPVP